MTPEHRYNLTIARRRRADAQRSIDESVLDIITPESAYWIGLLMADGCVGDNGRIWLTLKRSDSGHLEKFRSFTKCSLSIGFPPSVARIGFTSHKLAARLRDFGVSPRKSLTAQVLQLEDDKDFWRGVVDGDGSLQIRKDGYPQFCLVGAPILLDQFLSFIRRHVPWCSAKLTKNASLTVFITAGRTAADIVHFLYDGAGVALERKAVMAARIERRPFPTACKQGHLYSVFGRRTPNGKRVCRECGNIYSRRHRARIQCAC